MLFDRFSAYRFKVIDFPNEPAFRLSVIAGALFMMLWAFALGLVFS
jgi:hypothetical protein